MKIELLFLSLIHKLAYLSVDFSASIQQQEERSCDFVQVVKCHVTAEVMISYVFTLFLIIESVRVLNGSLQENLRKFNPDDPQLYILGDGNYFGKTLISCLLCATLGKPILS